MLLTLESTRFGILVSLHQALGSGQFGLFLFLQSNCWVLEHPVCAGEANCLAGDCDTHQLLATMS